MNDRTVRSTDPDPPAPVSEGPGTVIAGYRLLRTLGEGGFGVVFEAEQSVPIRRRVALKLTSLAWARASSWPASRPSGRRWR